MRPSTTSSSRTALTWIALCLLAAPTLVQARLKRTERLFDPLGQNSAQIVMGRQQECVTYQLAFPEACCPSSYTRVKSSHSLHPSNGKARDPGHRRRKAARAAAARVAKPTFGSDSPYSLGHHNLLKRMLDADEAWERHVEVAQRERTAGEVARSTPTVPLTARPKPNTARKAYEPRPTPEVELGEMNDSGPAEVAVEVEGEEVKRDERGCRIELVYTQIACPFADDKALVESHQIEQLEMAKDLAEGGNVMVECGRVGSFFY